MYNIMRFPFKLKSLECHVFKQEPLTCLKKNQSYFCICRMSVEHMTVVHSTVNILPNHFHRATVLGVSSLDTSSFQKIDPSFLMSHLVEFLPVSVSKSCCKCLRLQIRGHTYLHCNWASYYSIRRCKRFHHLVALPLMLNPVLPSNLCQRSSAFSNCESFLHVSPEPLVPPGYRRRSVWSYDLLWYDVEKLKIQKLITSIHKNSCSECGIYRQSWWKW